MNRELRQLGAGMVTRSDLCLTSITYFRNQLLDGVGDQVQMIMRENVRGFPIDDG